MNKCYPIQIFVLIGILKHSSYETSLILRTFTWLMVKGEIIGGMVSFVYHVVMKTNKTQVHVWQMDHLVLEFDSHRSG